MKNPALRTMSVHLAWQAIVYQSVNKYLSSGLPSIAHSLPLQKESLHIGVRPAAVL
ncbi:hypothetical protein COMA2_90162 [Candidatus Nitrospira nitrificans]|uniref:Uncharacterized protein n=1 Tax=Candidatus Nitrospira nitrificans TaxID=1742973 RepID=A0A0S4LRT9_9BACT|nr:hypothetical protein COMA2_90162 [Candidatus Nitrospira nitrificans]